MKRCPFYRVLIAFSSQWSGKIIFKVPILLHVGNAPSVKRPFRFENVWLEAEEFPHLVKTWSDQFHILGSSSYVLAKKLKLLKFKLNNSNRNVFRHLDTRMADLLEKVKL